MTQTLDFSDLLRLIDDRSAVFRAAVAAAPDLDVQVPTCPDWTLRELAAHLGEGRRAWAATVAAGPDATAKSAPRDASRAPRETDALLAWLAASTQELLDELRAAGPERGCWTWWGTSQTPRTVGAVARHQLHEVAIHTYDAQSAVGAPLPLPDEVAFDAIEEFLNTCCTTTTAWPHKPATLDSRTAEGPSWRQRLDADGVSVTRLPASGAEPADAGVQAPAADLALVLYGRRPLDSVHLEGDRDLIDLVWEWDPNE
ncbi:maleylpyruvate isomerase family mycothiol-dependent enzyme [Streptomyces sp. NPDC052225]|uniref:maleylpyruvate isomerase family mycothiol-dependent enzyme n=1 Tax=Streptomyces sp. NPDC052225 TaxID=3154949 RepID=UPI0034261FE7